MFINELKNAAAAVAAKVMTSCYNLIIFAGFAAMVAGLTAEDRTHIKEIYNRCYSSGIFGKDDLLSPAVKPKVFAP